VSAKDLFLRVECYVGLRRALGYVVTSEEKLLKDFVCFVEAQMVAGPIRAQTALDWACMPSPRRGLAGQTSRLKVVRGFLSHLQAAMPDTEVPGPGMLAKVRRPKPYLYSRQEIERVIAAASLLGPKGSLRPHTYATLIGLIASTGLRVSEAIRLTMRDIRFDADSSHLENQDSCLCTLQLLISFGCTHTNESAFIMTACRGIFRFRTRRPPVLRCSVADLHRSHASCWHQD
jgi:hypothetical protein